MADKKDGDGDDPVPPLSEPIIVPTIFANGVTVEAADGVLVNTYWTIHAEPPERRIAVRVATPVHVGRDHSSQTTKLLPRADS